MKRIRLITAAKAAAYGAMIAFAAHIGEAIPFQSGELKNLPLSAQTALFFTAGFLIYFTCVTAKQIYDQRKKGCA